MPESSAAALATMAEVVHVAPDQSTLNAAARSILDRKVGVLRDNPAMRIEVATKGQGELLVDSPGERAAAANCRGEFRLLVADPYLTNPGM